MTTKQMNRSVLASSQLSSSSQLSRKKNDGVISTPNLASLPVFSSIVPLSDGNVTRTHNTTIQNVQSFEDDTSRKKKTRKNEDRDDVFMAPQQPQVRQEEDDFDDFVEPPMPETDYSKFVRLINEEKHIASVDMEIFDKRVNPAQNIVVISLSWISPENPMNVIINRRVLASGNIRQNSGEQAWMDLYITYYKFQFMEKYNVDLLKDVKNHPEYKRSTLESIKDKIFITMDNETKTLDQIRELSVEHAAEVERYSEVIEAAKLAHLARKQTEREQREAEALAKREREAQLEIIQKLALEEAKNKKRKYLEAALIYVEEKDRFTESFVQDLHFYRLHKGDFLDHKIMKRIKTYKKMKNEDDSSSSSDDSSDDEKNKQEQPESRER